MIDNNVLTRAKNINNELRQSTVSNWTIIEIARFIEQWDAVTAKLREYYKKGDK